MNYLETYDVLGSSTPPPEPQQSLNEEVTEVIGQLGRFWGGFKKQSRTAFEAAHKDLSQVVTQAQNLAKQPQASSSSTAVHPSDEDSNTETGVANDGEITPHPSSSEDPASSALSTSGFFSRLQLAMPPNIVSAVQQNIPETLKQASGSVDLAQLRSSLSSEFQRVQGVTRAQAQEYVQKSEGLLREAMKEAGDVLRDAVKVIPPEQSGSGGTTPGIIWDGTDMWMLPSPAPEPQDPVDAEKGKGKESGPSSGRVSMDAQRAVATRAESLLKQLKCIPEILKHDPQVDANTQELYDEWERSEVQAKGGIDGEAWNQKISDALKETGDGEALQSTHDTLVPLNMENSTFWTRYFFRVHQIEREEERRKALLQSSITTDEDFSWEDEDEDATSPTRDGVPSASATGDDPAMSIATLSPENKTPHPPDILISSPQPSHSHTSATTSPRESSEDSYDLVSSGNVSAVESKKEDGAEEEDPDSDWE